MSTKDDYSANIDTLGSLTIGGSANGVIDNTNDTDWLKVSLIAGTRYKFTATSDHILPNLQLYNDKHELLVGEYDGSVDYTAQKSGSFYVALSGYGATTGNYQLTAALFNAADDFSAAANTTGVLTLAGPSNGNIEILGDEDWFKVDLLAGKSYQFTNSAGDTERLVLYDATGENVSSADYGSIQYNPTSSGSYYLSTQSISHPGAYQVSVALLNPNDDYSANKDTTGVLAVGGAVNGNIEVINDSDWLKVNLEAGKTYQFTQTQNNLYLGLSLYDADGEFVSSFSSYYGYGSYTPTLTGAYFLGINNNYTTGSYQVAATLLNPNDDYVANVNTTGALTVGGSASGVIEIQSDQDWLKANLDAGKTYHFASSVAGINLILYDATGEEVNSGSSSVDITTTAPGAYYLAVGSGYGYYTGSYQISTSVINPADDYSAYTNTTGTLSVGGTTNGNIEVGADKDWLKVDLVAGTNYKFAVTGASAPSLSLYDNTGKAFTFSGSSTFNFAPNDSGSYYLSVDGDNYSTGSYQASLIASNPQDDYSAATNTSGALTVGTVVSGKIEVSGDKDWFKANLTAGTTYEFSIAPSAWYGSMYLYDKSGKSVSSSDGNYDNSIITITPTTSDVYYLSASLSDYYGYGNTAIGTYKIAVALANPTDDYSAAINTTGALAIGGVTSGNFEVSSDADWFKVDLVAGTAYRFAYNSNDNTLTNLENLFKLYDSQGKLVEANQYNFVPEKSESYYLAASTDGYTGKYEIDAQLVGNDAPTIAHPIADQIATQDSAFSYQIPENTFVDVDGNPLTYSVTLADGSALPAWLSFNATNNTFTGTPADANVGSMEIKVVAVDTSNTNATDSFILNVADVRDDMNMAGSAKSDNLTGDAIDSGSYDKLSGLAGNDTLTGLGGDDTLDGGKGADKMFGGQGNDIYIVDNAGDVVTELADQGTDQITSLVNLVLAKNVENLVLQTGSAAKNGTGNTLNNMITGNQLNNKLDGGSGDDLVFGGAGNDNLLGGLGNDKLYGEAGNDTLDGGKGNDIFVFATGAGHDVINHFGDKAGNQDLIDLSSFGLKFSDLHVADTSKGAVITGATPNDFQITLTGVKAATIGADDFMGLLA